ncbi:Scr1 family TA system antitoxin-like transcriptional regulator [Streptomyces sp. NPDC006459]|uniref:Scr1 family TA system antitoxin-like transcriptional regulator n=1 Tax=Streptomyces sp. NPDC006459 TaxID=3154303 RepID=UPI0033BBEAE3
MGSSEVTREQLDQMTHLSAQSHITVQVLPHDVGAHPGVSGGATALRHYRATATCMRACRPRC